jgi:Zn-dependent peptidase ImmA (M78 family)
MIVKPADTKALIDRLVRGTGAADARSAIRQKATNVIDSFVEAFGEPEDLPLDLPTLASFLGIKLSDTAPAFSPDAELAPDGSGGVEIRVNPDRPETRVRFSVGHEITHTFFPDHSFHIWPRADSRYRDLGNPDDYLEMLCDVGAAELVFPRRWFVGHAASVRSASDLVALAATYRASRHATVRRFAELNEEAMAAVFFNWKLKPTQKAEVGRTDQLNLFNITREEEIQAALRLRVDYAIASQPSAAAGHFIPRDKSVESDGPLYTAASSGLPCDGECYLELGQASGYYRVHALPLWTPAECLGPAGENAVAAAIWPRNVPRARRKSSTAVAPGLFG